MATEIHPAHPAPERRLRGATPHADGEFRRMLDRLPAGAYTCDAEGLITYYNPRSVELWGRAPKLLDAADRWCGSFRLFDAGGAPIQHDECWMALAVRQNREFTGHEIVIERPDGARLTALAHATPLRDASGVLLGAVNVLVDITERKRAEESLREADRANEEFLATLSHELRNPLAPIRHAVELLRMQQPPTPEWRWALEVIDRQTRLMNRLIDDLLDVSRLRRNALDIRRERVALAEVLRAAVEMCRPLVDARRQELHVELPDAPVILHADSARLAQAFSNLLNNAARYTGLGGKIRLSAAISNGSAVVSVRDTGAGIPADMLPRIFEMFTQAPVAGARSGEGMGVGLALVRRLVDLHGGTVTARSDGPGMGSEFVVTLPLAAGDAPAAKPVQPGRIAPAQPLRILVVDDDRDSVDGLTALLELVGNRVRGAHDAAEALRAAAEFEPDVAILDIGLPGMDGYEAARILRSRAPGVHLVALTGWGREDDRDRAREAGFDHHLVKPVEPAVLLRHLAGLRPRSEESR